MTQLDVTFECGETSLSVRSYSIVESISTPFDVTLEAVSAKPDIDTASIVGKGAAFHLRTALGEHAVARRWTGVCRSMELLRAVAAGKGESTYLLRLSPVIWVLSQRRNVRMFQHLSVVDIVRKVLAEWRIEPVVALDARVYPKLEYRVQYGESDLDFVSRMLEEWGISYFFTDDERRGSTVVLSDSPEAAEARAPVIYEDEPTRVGGREAITSARLSHDVRPGAVTIRDYDFRRPAYPMIGSARNPATPESYYEVYQYQPGGFLVEKDERSATPAADDRGTARHDPGAGALLAQRRLESQRASQRRVTFETNVSELRPGVVFSLSGHPSDAIDGKRLLAIDLTTEGSATTEQRTTGVAVFADQPFRPPLRTPKPRMFGVQSAIVVGPKGHEIHTDEYGRVRVQFLWDREGQYDDSSSCWMRVSHGSAGGSFGMVVMPRVGQEVLVGFLDGDPDQPVVVGRVFNATSPVPYKLPDQKTMTGLKGASSPAGTGGFNEIRFDDATGSEKMHVRAERDMEKLVQNDEKETTGGHRHVEVKKDLKKTVEGLEQELTKGKRMLGVAKDMCKMVGGHEGESTNGNRRIQVGGKLEIDVTGSHHETCQRERVSFVRGFRDSVVVDADNLSAKTIVLNAGRTKEGGYQVRIVLEEAKITMETPDSKLILDGPNVSIQAPKGSIDLWADKIKVRAKSGLQMWSTDSELGSTGSLRLWGERIDLND